MRSPLQPWGFGFGDGQPQHIMVSIILSRAILSLLRGLNIYFFSNHRWLSDVRSLRQAMSFGSSPANKCARHCEQYKTKTQEWSPADRSPIQNKQIPKGLQRMKNDHNDINTKVETHLERQDPWLCEVGHDTDGNREQTRGVLRHTQGALKIEDWFSLEFFCVQSCVGSVGHLLRFWTELETEQRLVFVRESLPQHLKMKIITEAKNEFIRLPAACCWFHPQLPCCCCCWSDSVGSPSADPARGLPGREL